MRWEAICELSSPVRCAAKPRSTRISSDDLDGVLDGGRVPSREDSGHSEASRKQVTADRAGTISLRSNEAHHIWEQQLPELAKS